MPLTAVRTSAPATGAVSTEDVATHLRIDPVGSPAAYQDQTYFEGLRDAAIDWLEGPNGYLGGRALINQTWRFDLPAFPSDGVIEIPLLPTSSISSIVYYDEDNASQTLATSVYALLTDELGAYVDLQVDQEWPSTYDRADALRITFVAGYGAAPSNVPAAIRHAILLMVGHWYANREAVVIGDSVSDEMPLAVERLLMPYRRKWHALA